MLGFIKTSLLPGFVGFTLLTTLAHASPQTMRIEGSLFSSAGIPFTGSKDLQVKAYAAATGGSALWTSAAANTTVTSGRYSLSLDASSGNPSLVSVIAARTSGQAIYYEVVVDSGTANGTMDTPIAVAPRITARGTTFALNAAQADTITGVTTTNLASVINGIGGGGGGGSYVAIAGSTMTGALYVNGGQVAANQTVGTGATANFATGNLQVLSSVGTTAITLQNMLDGGAYTLIVNDTTSRQYTFADCTAAYWLPANGATIGGTRTIYNILKTTISSTVTCFINWSTGYN